MPQEKKLLLIGGGKSDQETIRQAMESDGYQVRHVREGASGMRAAMEFTPSVVVLDSLVSCQQLRQSVEHEETPIIWLTEADEEGQATAAMRAGADELLRKPVTTLEVRARVRAVTHAHLLRQKAKEILQLRQDFMDQLVHDIRSPLQVILGFSELLSESVDVPAAERNQIRSIRGAASRLENLADNLIVTTRLETGDLIPQSQPTSPVELAVRVVEAMRPIAAVKRVEIDLDMPPECEWLSVDAQLISRALQIYVDNAIRVSPGGSRVMVRVNCNGSDGTTAFEVVDRGPEIPEGEREAVFDLALLMELKKAGHARHGRGLGLSLCRLVADAHGGHARVVGNPGGGSVFILELPPPAN